VSLQCKVVNFIEPQLSGAILLDQISVLRERYGQAKIDAAIAALDPQDRAELSGLLAMSWCRAELAMRFKNALAKVVDVPPLELQRFVSSAGIERTVKGVWRFLLKQLWDDALMRRVPMIYSRTFNHGDLRAEDVTSRGARFVLSGWPTIPDYDAHGLSYGIESVLNVAGRARPKVVWKREAAEVVFTATWSAKA